MKKALFILLAVAALCCSCDKNKCKCTYKDNNGNKATEEITKADDQKCSDFNTSVAIGGAKADMKCTPTM